MATGNPSVPAENVRSSTVKSSTLVPSPRCPHCNSRRENPRNLVICIDGTSNQFGHNNTNVVKLFAKVDLESKETEQCAYYSSGIGTRPDVYKVHESITRAISDSLDMAVAWNIEEIVKDAYGWLARTYREGDQIYLFGFSRGAYQVRVLAGMIHEVGLIRTPTEKQLGTAYNYYKGIHPGRPKTRQIAKEFKNTFSWKDLRVHFVGVWDTVSSVGLRRKDVFLSTSSSAAHACHFRHALALDERRVKFMPEYFREMNSWTECGSNDNTADLIGEESASDRSSDISAKKQKRTTEIKEVWFAGSHSDVGGRNKPGKSHQAGNVSLLWMRREAAEKGLVLLPTDIVWVPDDINFGISESMTSWWNLAEMLPLTHQVSFSGAGEDSWCWHLWESRRIIPGQKVHASILYANAYRPFASSGKGFDIPIVHGSLSTKLDSEIWETGLFDGSAAQELINYLSNKQGVAPIYLDRLLFMLQFQEGRECVRKVPNWEKRFEDLFSDKDCASLVRLVSLVAFYEASYDPEALGGSAQPCIEPSQKVFNEIENGIKMILESHKHRDSPRVVALLKLLTKHEALRNWLLTKDVLHKLLKLLDEIITRRSESFPQAMDGLSWLLQCEQTQKIFLEKLKEPCTGSKISRLEKILRVKNKHYLTAALRMTMKLAQIEKAKDICSTVKRRIRLLAHMHDGLVGHLAIEVYLALFDPQDSRQINFYDSTIRQNLASALRRFNPHECALADSGGKTLRNLLGLDAQELTPQHEMLLAELKLAILGIFQTHHERVVATMTLLKLCESDIIRNHLIQTKLLDILVEKLKIKETALLAAYALAICLKYNDMRDKLMDNQDFPKNIVRMLRRDYFDDAVDSMEGFQIFRNLMQCDGLRKKIEKCGIAQILEKKLQKGKDKETRTSLICLDLLRCFDKNSPWTNELVEKSINCLRSSKWSTQKSGVTILSALAQTEHGAWAIHPKVREIIEMLLPDGYLPIPLSEPDTKTANVASPLRNYRTSFLRNPLDHCRALIRSRGWFRASAADPLPVEATETTTNSNSRIERAVGDVSQKSPSWMMGPVCALRVLAQNEKLRKQVREMIQYGSLKHLHLSGTLVGDTDTSPLYTLTPNRTDVVDMLDKMIEAIDGDLFEKSFMLIGDDVLPHIQHWDRLAVGVMEPLLLAALIIGAIPAAAVSAALGLVAGLAFIPIFFPFAAYQSFMMVKYGVHRRPSPNPLLGRRHARKAPRELQSTPSHQT